MIEEITCLNCPLRCKIEVNYDENCLYDISGNTCERGHKFAEDKFDRHKKNYSTFVKVINGKTNSVKVITSSPISKELINKVSQELNNIKINVPIKINDIILKDVMNSGINIIATENIAAK